jgi:hypothetical protein
MLETGKDCICCGIKHPIKDISIEGVCKICDEINFDHFQKEQGELYDRFKMGDSSISRCSCRSFFLNRGTRKKCNACRVPWESINKTNDFKIGFQ